MLHLRVNNTNIGSVQSARPHSQIQVERRGGGHRRGGGIMLEEAQQHIDGETAEEVDAVGAQEGRV